MSMIGNFKALSPRLLEGLRENPALIYEVIGIPTADGQFDLSSLQLPSFVKKSIASLSDEQRDQALEALKEVDEGHPEASQGPTIFMQKIQANLLEQMRNLLRRTGCDEKPAMAKELRDAGFSDEDRFEALDIQKAWHGVHFLLCGGATCEEDTPRGQSILGGLELGEDVGYGPARFLEQQEVKEIAAVLRSISPNDLSANFDPERMNAAGIYPGGWDREEGPQWLLDAYVEVRDYYNQAAEKGFAMLLYLT